MKKFQPDEAALLKRIYDKIVAEPWFNRNAITERELIKLILTEHALRDETGLQAYCFEEARKRFSR